MAWAAKFAGGHGRGRRGDGLGGGHVRSSRGAAARSRAQACHRLQGASARRRSPRLGAGGNAPGGEQSTPRMLATCVPELWRPVSPQRPGSAPRAATRSCSRAATSGASPPCCSPIWSGFTTLSESRDPEQVKNLVDACFQLLARDITSFGGQVDKIVGDAIVALFGAPVAHEDDAERAVRAALRMQETVRSLPRRDRRAGRSCASGSTRARCWSGALRAGGDYTAMGDVVNTAQRLETVAEPGSVVVGPATPRRHPRGHRLPVARVGRGQGPRRAGRGVDRHRAAAAARPSAAARCRPRSSGATPSWGCWATPSTPPSSAAAPTCCC